jgi:transposase-like protein
VKDFESGTFTVSQMSRLYGVSDQALYNWIRKYSSIPSSQAVIVEVPNSQSERVKQLETRIAELERALGRKQIELDYQAELLRVLEENGVGVQKKGSATKPSADSSRKTTEP